MNSRFNANPLITDQEENDNSAQESGPESPPSNDMKMPSTSSPKRSKKAMQRRVVSIPIKDLEGSRLKGENASPPSQNHHKIHHNSSSPKHITTTTKPEVSTTQPDNPEPEHEEKFTDLGNDGQLISTTTTSDEFSWFGEMETTSSTILETPFYAEAEEDADHMASMFFPMRDEDESLFADLGELPECSSVFRHQRGGVGPQVQIC
ncbi:WRKY TRANSCRIPTION FACTOR 21-RELATED [Salix purpurea]|uniref:WRKY TRANSCRIPTION FACTOR 21-RELATED n=1 Tax=Salix purpurea TaxID=77065 RepID=A0A9Q1AGA5_SALPP|nr:WRKY TRANSCRIPTION FACTOR 21-RELATED [Salix purpurea]